MRPSCRAHLSPVSTKAPHSHSQPGGRDPERAPVCGRSQGRCQQGPPLRLHSTPQEAGEQLQQLPASLQALCTGRNPLAVGFVGMLPWGNLPLLLHTSWNACRGSAQTNLHSTLLCPPCAQQTEAIHPCLLDLFMAKKPSSTFGLVFRGQSACSDLLCPF